MFWSGLEWRRVVARWLGGVVVVGWCCGVVVGEWLEWWWLRGEGRGWREFYRERSGSGKRERGVGSFFFSSRVERGSVSDFL